MLCDYGQLPRVAADIHAGQVTPPSHAPALPDQPERPGPCPTPDRCRPVRLAAWTDAIVMKQSNLRS